MSNLSFGQVGSKHYSSCTVHKKKCEHDFVQKSCTNKSEPVLSFFSIFGDKVIKILNIFSPLIFFINNFDSKKVSEKEDSRKVVYEFSDALDKIVNNEELNKLLSRESKQRVDRLSKAVSVIRKLEGLSNSEMSELIRNWRESEDTKYLLEMAKRIRSRHCAPFKDERLRQAFIRSLESLAFALEEISKHPYNPESQRAVEEITQGAHSTVDAVEHHNEKGGDGNFTQADKKFVKDKLENATNHASEVVNNPTLSKYLGSACSCLRNWISYTNEFIRDWYEEQEEELEDKEKKLCEERKLKEKLAYELCRIKCIKARRAENFYFMMKHAQRKIEEFLQIKSKYCNTKYGLDKHERNYDFSRTKYRCEAISAEFYETKKNEIIDSLPPCYVGGSSLDLLC